MPSSPDPSGHMRTPTFLLEPPSAYGAFSGCLFKIAPSSTVIQHVTNLNHADLQRLHSGAFFVCVSSQPTHTSGEHHG